MREKVMLAIEKVLESNPEGLPVQVAQFKVMDELNVPAPYWDLVSTLVKKCLLGPGIEVTVKLPID